MLAASGCWTEDVQKALWVLAPLAQHNCGDWTVKGLLDVLPVVFYEQLGRKQMDEFRQAGNGASGRIVNGEFPIKPGSHG